MSTNYPLSWPIGWPRTNVNSRKRAQFGKTEKVSYGTGGSTYNSKKELTVAAAMPRLFSELNRLKATAIILSTNVETRVDGFPRSDRRAPDDPGVAVYFKLDGKDRVLACDKWDRVADNIAALAAHIDAIRRQDRYGVGSLDRAFAGYAALPAPKSNWRFVLGFGHDYKPTIAEVQKKYRQLIFVNHPDHGGSDETMSKLNAARDHAIKELSC